MPQTYVPNINVVNRQQILEPTIESILSSFKKISNDGRLFEYVNAINKLISSIELVNSYGSLKSNEFLMLNEKKSAEYLYAVYDLLAYVVLKYKANDQTVNLLNKYINKLADYIKDPTIGQSDVKAALNTIQVTEKRPSSILGYFWEKVSKISSDNYLFENLINLLGNSYI